MEESLLDLSSKEFGASHSDTCFAKCACALRVLTSRASTVISESSSADACAANSSANLCSCTHRQRILSDGKASSDISRPLTQSPVCELGWTRFGRLIPIPMLHFPNHQLCKIKAKIARERLTSNTTNSNLARRVCIRLYRDRTGRTLVSEDQVSAPS